MANDNFKVKVQLEATADKNQIEKEATQVANTAQQTLDKKQLKLNIEDNLTNLKKKLEETRIAYQNLLNQPMNGTTDKQLQQLEDQMEDLRNEIKEDEKALNDLGATSSKTGNLLKNLATKISALAIAGKALNFLKNTFNDFQESQKEIVKATGASGEALQQLTNDMLDIQGKVGQSQKEIAEAVGELNTRLGLSGRELQNFTEKYLKFASITGQDGKQAIAENVRLFNIRGVSIDKQLEYLDKLVVAGQKTGISVSTLTNQLQANAPVLQELGFSLDDSIALLSNFEQAGIETSQVLSSMKMGLKNLAEDGVSPMESLNDVIQGVQNGTMGLNEVMEIFGSRGGTAMYNAIKNGTFALDDMKSSLEDVSGAVEDTYNEMETLGDFISRKWNGIVADFVQWNNEGFQSARKVYHVIKDELTPSIEEMKEEGNKLKNMIVGWIKGERELRIENGYFVSTLTESGKQAEITRKKEELLKKTLEELGKSREEAKTALDRFNDTKVDDSKTRAEFEADRKSALNAMIAFQQAYSAKMKYFDLASDGKGKAWNKRGGYLAALNEDIRKTYLSQFSGKVTEDDGGILGDELLGGGSGGGGSSKSKAEEMLEAFKDELKDLHNEMDDTVSDHQKRYDDIVKSIKKVGEEYEKLKDKAQDTWESAEKSLKSYNEQLEKSQADAVTNLGQRYVELKKELIDVDSYMKKIAEDLSWKELGWMQENGTTEYRGYELKDLIELKEKLDEMKLIEENTTEDQRKSEEFTKKTSKAQEILNNLKEKELELQEKIAAATEKQKIAESVMSNEGFVPIQSLTKDGEDIGTYFYDSVTGAWEKIHNADNIEYAKQLEDQMKNLDDQKAQLEQEKNEEVEILVDINARKTQLEKEYTKTFQEEVAKQKKSVEELVSYWDRLIARKNEYYSSGTSARAYGGEISKARVTLVGENGPERIVARQSSYVQPRNASNSYSTTNTTNNDFSINGMAVNVNNVDEFLDDLKQRLTYRS